MLQTQTAKCQLLVSAKMNKKQVVAYEDVKLAVTLTNRAGQPIKFVNKMRRKWIEFVVERGNGQQTVFAKKDAIYAPALLNTGETRTSNFTLNSSYDLSQPGNYTVYAIVRMPGQSAEQGTRSQKVHFTVIFPFHFNGIISANINVSVKTESEDTFFKQIFLLCLKNVFLLKNVFMPRILAIDFGKKRTGIAVTDELQIIASGLTTVNTSELIPFLKEYVAKEKVELFLVGKPKQMNNSDSESEALILPFLKKLENLFPQIPIKRIDERFTSKMAFQTMIDSGMKKQQRRNKAMVDEISATIILQSYLYSK